jgi:hypothetical protein
MPAARHVPIPRLARAGAGNGVVALVVAPRGGPLRALAITLGKSGSPGTRSSATPPCIDDRTSPPSKGDRPYAYRRHDSPTHLC